MQVLLTYLETYAFASHVQLDSSMPSCELQSWLEASPTQLQLGGLRNPA